MPNIYVDVEMDDFGDNELIEELIDRGYTIVEGDPKQRGNLIEPPNSTVNTLQKAGYPDWLVGLVRDWEQCPWAMSKDE